MRIKNFKRKNNNFMSVSYLIFLILLISSWAFIFNSESGNLSEFFSSKNYFYTKRFIGRLFNFSSENSALKNIESWKAVFFLSLETLNMSILAILFSAISMILVVIPAAKNTASGELILTKKWWFKPLYFLIRGMYIFSRAIPELIWAMIIIFVLKPGMFAGAVALAIHNFGILGKLCTEVVEDIDLKPIRNLSSSGAKSGQILIYGIIPTVMPKFITYILYRWEVIIRTTVVVGFVGAGGLGRQFKLSMSWFKYTEITQLIICYLILVSLADLICIWLRKIVND